MSAARSHGRWSASATACPSSSRPRRSWPASWKPWQSRARAKRGSLAEARKRARPPGFRQNAAASQTVLYRRTPLAETGSRARWPRTSTIAISETTISRHCCRNSINLHDGCRENERADSGRQIASGAAKEVHDMNWKQRVLEAAAGIVLIALPVHAQQVGPTDRDERIVSFIHQANLHEIAAANLAKAKSSSQDVKDFADQMITDHQSADEQLRSYAQAHEIDLDGLRRHLTDVDNQRLEDERESKALGTATGEWAFTWENANVARRENAKTLARLRSLDGAAFDREFASDMVQGHQRVVDRLVDARDRGIDPDLRKLIDSLLPTVKHHLEMAQALQGVVAKA